MNAFKYTPTYSHTLHTESTHDRQCELLSPVRWTLAAISPYGLHFWGAIFLSMYGPSAVPLSHSRMTELCGLWLTQWCGFRKGGCWRSPTESCGLKLQVSEPMTSSTRLHTTTPSSVTCFFGVIQRVGVDFALCHKARLYLSFLILQIPRVTQSR